MFIYLILCIIFNFSTSIPISRNKSNFLIEGELKNLNFREGCLKTTRCSEPRFQLSLLSNNNQDAIRIDASIDKNMQIVCKILSFILIYFLAFKNKTFKFVFWSINLHFNTFFYNNRKRSNF